MKLFFLLAIVFCQIGSTALAQSLADLNSGTWRLSCVKFPVQVHLALGIKGPQYLWDSPLKLKFSRSADATHEYVQVENILQYTSQNDFKRVTRSFDVFTTNTKDASPQLATIALNLHSSRIDLLPMRDGRFLGPLYILDAFFAPDKYHGECLLEKDPSVK